MAYFRIRLSESALIDEIRSRAGLLFEGKLLSSQKNYKDR